MDMARPNCAYCGTVLPHHARAAQQVAVVNQMMADRNGNGIPDAFEGLLANAPYGQAHLIGTGLPHGPHAPMPPGVPPMGMPGAPGYPVAGFAQVQQFHHMQVAQAVQKTGNTIAVVVVVAVVGVFLLAGAVMALVLVR
jgi:hypothetical protein